METESDKAAIVEENADPRAVATEALCVACRRPIRPKARVCPTCKSPQHPTRWTIIGDGLKWFGGIAALLSLLITAWKLVEFASAAQEKSKAVHVLLAGAAVQRDTPDRQGALMLIDQALAIDPTAREVRDARLDFAMAHIRYFLSVGTTERLADLQSAYAIVQQGTAHSNSTRKADAIAHLGWYQHLRCMVKDCSSADTQREHTPLIQALFQQALQVDPDNPFAHAFWASWCLNGYYGFIDEPKTAVCQDPVALATEHFAAALKTGRAREEVYRRIIVFLAERDLETRWPNLFPFLDEIRNSDAISPSLKEKLVREIGETIESEEKFGKIRVHPEKRVFADVLTWILQDRQMAAWIEDRRIDVSTTFWQARLYELEGDNEDAVRLYRQARIEPSKRGAREPSSPSFLVGEINEALRRLLNVGPGWLGVEWEDVSAPSDLGLGDQSIRHVKLVESSGPAARAGLQPGDFVTAVDGAPIESGRALFVLETKQAGESAQLSVWKRNEGLVIVPVTLVDWPTEQPQRSGYYGYAEWFRNIALDKRIYGDSSDIRPLFRQDAAIATLTDELRNDFGIPRDVVGAIVVSARSLGRSRYTVGPGDVIVGIGDRTVVAAEDVVEALENKRDGEQEIAITRYRDGQLRTMTWKL